MRQKRSRRVMAGGEEGPALDTVARLVKNLEALKAAELTYAKMQADMEQWGTAKVHRARAEAFTTAIVLVKRMGAPAAGGRSA